MKDGERRDRFLVDEMLTHLSLLGQIGERGKSAFIAPEGAEARYAAEHALELFAEAVEKVSGTFEKANPKIPWRRFRPFRRRVAHPYDHGSEAVNVDELWEFLAHDVPVLRKSLRKARFPPTPQA